MWKEGKGGREGGSSHEEEGVSASLMEQHAAISSVASNFPAAEREEVWEASSGITDAQALEKRNRMRDYWVSVYII